MEAAPTLPSPREIRSQDNERRCLVTGEVLPKANLLRFVVGPDETIVPDLAEDLPGRGLWVSLDRTTLEAAASGNVFSKAARQSVIVPPGLIDQIEFLLRKRCLDFLGLARRSGIAVLGQPQVETAINAKALKLLVIADDASANGVVDVTQMRQFGDMPVIRSFNRMELGTALGYDQMVYIGLKFHALTNKFLAEWTRLDKITRKDHFTGNKG